MADRAPAAALLPPAYVMQQRGRCKDVQTRFHDPAYGQGVVQDTLAVVRAVRASLLQTEPRADAAQLGQQIERHSRVFRPHRAVSLKYS